MNTIPLSSTRSQLVNMLRHFASGVFAVAMLATAPSLALAQPGPISRDPLIAPSVAGFRGPHDGSSAPGSNTAVTPATTPAPAVPPSPAQHSSPITNVGNNPATHPRDLGTVGDTLPTRSRATVVRTADRPNQGPPPGRGPGPGRPEVRVRIDDPHAGPRFYTGPGRDDFFFVRGAPERRSIDSRDSLRDILLRPFAEAVAWGIGDIATVEVANLLGLPINTTLYAVQPEVPVFSTLPPGYFVAQGVPENVALVRNGPYGPEVVVRRVPPGSFIAYQTSTSGVVLNECVVVPPVQQVIVYNQVPMVTTPAPTVVMTTPAPAPAPVAAPATPAPEPAPAANTSIPMSSKTGKIVYDSNAKPVGVIILDADGKQEFVPIQ